MTGLKHFMIKPKRKIVEGNNQKNLQKFYFPEVSDLVEHFIFIQQDLLYF